MLATKGDFLVTDAAESAVNIDLLNRQDFIEQLVDIAESLSANNGNACYAINGEWGVGKTYVLEAFEKKIRSYGKENTTLSKYLVFHYNCWQYDYYEEPLIAIVAAILDQIDEQVLLIPGDKKDLFIATLKAIGISMWGKACAVIEEQTGVDLEEIAEIMKTGNESATEQIAKNHSYDSYFDFKKTLEKLSETIENLAKDQTVILVVDELDRCLPEYTIKVLERLHHIFDTIPNVQVVLAVDKRQLENTIKGIYGEKVSVRRYLAKFIDFELKLVTGEVTNEVKEVYKQYYDNFTYDISSNSEIDVICTTLLKGVDIRTCKAIIEKSFLCHRLLNPTGEKYDAAVLCVEIFLSLLKEYDLNVAVAKNNFNIYGIFTSETSPQNNIFSSTSKVLPGLAILSDKYKPIEDDANYMSHGINNNRTYIYVKDLWGLLLGCYRKILGFEGDIWTDRFPKTVAVGNITLQEYILKYWKFIKIIN
ncbi:MAG: hypothetical protein IKU81_05690 [Oscillibacter sp.]|nr:hypothetical protein [Oscillibacter sp.]